MGEAKRRKKYDVRVMCLKDRDLYVTNALKFAKAKKESLSDGDKLYAAFEAMLRFVVSSEKPYLGGCHDTSAALFMRLRDLGLNEQDVALCIGEVNATGSIFDHSWLEVRGEVFDVAICAPLETGGFAGGPVFAGLDLTTNCPTKVNFGVKSEAALDADAARVHSIKLSGYMDLQITLGSKPMTDLIKEVYAVDNDYAQELLKKYGSSNREWRNPLLNPKKSDIRTS